MEIDKGRLKRLLSMIEAQPSAKEKGDGMTFRGAHLTETYNLMLTEVKDVLPTGLHEEFERLFKPLPPAPSSHQDLFGQSAATERAIGSFANLSGWLRGLLSD